MKRRSWKEILSRINSISIAGIASAAWSPSPNERKICEEVATYLEDQGILHSPFEWEHPKETYSAAASVRSQLTTHMQKLNRDMGSFEHLDAIRQALQTFQRELRALKLSTTESKSEMTNEQITDYDHRLINLRNTASYRIALIASQCEFSITDELWQWLPNEPLQSTRAADPNGTTGADVS
jgi:HPt (histidine-containing phosphotransfer) domain-containing protein